MRKANLKSYIITAIVFAFLSAPMAMSMGVSMIVNDWIIQGNQYVLVAGCFTIISAVLAVMAAVLGIIGTKNINCVLASAILSIIGMIFCTSGVGAPTYIFANYYYLIFCPTAGGFMLISFVLFAVYYAKSPIIKNKKNIIKDVANVLQSVQHFKKLYDDGIISEDEFNSKKKSIFDNSANTVGIASDSLKLSKGKKLALFLVPLLVAVCIVSVSIPTADAVISNAMVDDLLYDMAHFNRDTFEARQTCVGYFARRNGERSLKIPGRYGIWIGRVSSDYELVCENIDALGSDTKKAYYNLAQIQYRDGRWDLSYYLSQITSSLITETLWSDGENGFYLGETDDGYGNVTYGLNTNLQVMAEKNEYGYYDVNVNVGRSVSISNKNYEMIFECSDFRVDCDSNILKMTLYSFADNAFYDLQADVWLSGDRVDLD